MASNFSIRHHCRKDGLHLKLSGDFDGSSALELNDCLHKLLKNNRSIYVHTDQLARLPEFGRQMFVKQFGHRPPIAGKVVFMGARANDIAPEGCRIQG